jgi:hypothetical protein
LPDDDLIDCDFIAVCMEAFLRRPDIGIVRTGTRIIDAEGNIIVEYPNRANGGSAEELFLAWFSGITSPYMCSSLMHRSKLLDVGGYDPGMNLWQDVGAEFRLAALYGEEDIYDIKASFRRSSGEITFTSKVATWCDDSHRLLELLTSLVPGKEKLIREKGLPFLANINYNRAGAVKSMARRLVAYFVVYRKFGYRFKPREIHLFRPI